jgi:hypothetical protein
MVSVGTGPTGMLLVTAEAMAGGEAHPGVDGVGGTLQYCTWLVLRGDKCEDIGNWSSEEAATGVQQHQNGGGQRERSKIY